MDLRREIEAQEQMVDPRTRPPDALWADHLRDAAVAALADLAARVMASSGRISCVQVRPWAPRTDLSVLAAVEAVRHRLIADGVGCRAIVACTMLAFPELLSGAVVGKGMSGRTPDRSGALRRRNAACVGTDGRIARNGRGECRYGEVSAILDWIDAETMVPPELQRGYRSPVLDEQQRVTTFHGIVTPGSTFVRIIGTGQEKGA